VETVLEFAKRPYSPPVWAIPTPFGIKEITNQEAATKYMWLCKLVKKDEITDFGDQNNGTLDQR